MRTWLYDENEQSSLGLYMLITGTSWAESLVFVGLKIINDEESAVLCVSWIIKLRVVICWDFGIGVFFSLLRKF